MTIMNSAQISQLISQQQAMAYNQMQYAQALSSMNMGMAGTVQPAGGTGAGGFAAASTMMQGMQYAPQIGTTLGLAGGIAAGAMGLGGMSLGGAGGIAAGAGIGGLLGGPGGALAGAAWGALPAGLAAPLMAIPAAAGYAASQMGQGFAQYGQTREALSGFNFGNAGARSGRGFSAGQAGQITSMLRDVAASTTGAGMQELTQMVAQIPDTGLMQGVRDAQEFSRKFKEIIGGVKQMAEVLGTSLSEALPFFADMRRSGFYTAQDVLGNAVQRQILGSQGFSGTQFTALQRGGAAIAQAHGARRVTGARLATRLAGDIGGAVESGIISEEMVMEATGGVGGAAGYGQLAGRFTEQAFNFTRTPVGRAMMLAMGEKEDGRYTGGIDQGQLARLRAGDIDVTNVRAEGSRRLGGGRGSRISFVANEELIRGNAAEQMGPEIIESVVRDVAGGRGIAGSEDDIVMLLMKRFTNLGRGEAEVMVEVARNARQIRVEQRERMLQEIDREIEQANIRSRHSWEGKKEQLKSEYNLALAGPLRREGQAMGMELEEGINRFVDRLHGRTETRFTDADRLRAKFGGLGAFQSDAGAITSGDVPTFGRGRGAYLGMLAGGPLGAVGAGVGYYMGGRPQTGTAEYKAGVMAGGDIGELEEMERRRAEGRFTPEMLGGRTQAEAGGDLREALMGVRGERRERIYRRMEAGRMGAGGLARRLDLESADVARAGMRAMGFTPNEEYAVGATRAVRARQREEAEAGLTGMARGPGPRRVIGPIVAVNRRGIRRERVMKDLLASENSGAIASFLSSGSKEAQLADLEKYGDLLSRESSLTEEETRELEQFQNRMPMDRKQVDTLRDIVKDADEDELKRLAGNLVSLGNAEKNAALEDAAKKTGRGLRASATTKSMERAGLDKAVQAEISAYITGLERGDWTGDTAGLAKAVFGLQGEQRGDALAYLGRMDPGLAEAVTYRARGSGLKGLVGKQYKGRASRQDLLRDIGGGVGEWMEMYEGLSAGQRQEQLGAEGEAFYADLTRAIEDSKLSQEEAEMIGEALADAMDRGLISGGVTGGTKSGGVGADVANLATSVESAAKANTIFVQAVADNVKGLTFDPESGTVDPSSSEEAVGKKGWFRKGK